MDTVALVLGIYGALLSTALGVYQCLRDRRRLLVTSGTLITVDAEDELLMVLEVRVINEGHRPVQIRKGGTILPDGSDFVPYMRRPAIPRPVLEAPVLLEDGQSVSFYFDARSFNGEEWLPTAVYVQDFADRKYVTALSHDERATLRDLVQKATQALGSAD